MEIAGCEALDNGPSIFLNFLLHPTPRTGLKSTLVGSQAKHLISIYIPLKATLGNTLGLTLDTESMAGEEA